MKVATIREKLSDYIRIADDEKIKAMYVLFKSEMNEELEWWQNNDLLQTFDTEYANWKTGKTKGYSLKEVDEKIEQTRAKREGK